MNYIAILAGNANQFNNLFDGLVFLKKAEKIDSLRVKIGNDIFFYAVNKDSLRGIKLKEYKIIGTFFDRTDCQEIQEMADSRIK
jgi:hypothetical protein